jgi:hypothetical protein
MDPSESEADFVTQIVGACDELREHTDMRLAAFVDELDELDGTKDGE